MSTYKLKVIFAGAPAVGKTSLLHHFVRDNFPTNYLVTGVDIDTSHLL